MLSEEFLEKYKHKEPSFGFNGLGYIVYKRTYSRIKDDNTKEEWWETVRRVVENAKEIGSDYTDAELEELYDKVFNMKLLFSGRAFWQLGAKPVKSGYGDSLINCWSCSVNKLDSFTFAFNELMLGGGVGFSIKKEHVYELPKVKKNVNITHIESKDADYIVPDSREGWVELLRKVLESFFITSKSFTYSTILVRPYGSLIKGFGGIASGPKILIDGIQNICNILKLRENKKIRPIDALDIMNIIGSIVVSGNVRRSAMLALGDNDDLLYLRAKRWDLGNIPNWRAMSNNSIDVEDYDDIPEEFWKGYMGNGEPYGIINLKNARRFGRLGEKCSDDLIECFNPCAEATLAPYESCNLSEIVLPRIETFDELKRCIYLIYKYQKQVCLMKYLHKESEQIIRKNMRIGVGITGIAESLDKIEWLDPAYKYLKMLDKEYSRQKNINESIKLTVVKPSGTLSLLPGVTPGVHPAYAKYYIRRVRMSSTDELVYLCRKAGLNVEYVKTFDGKDDRNTVVIEFPCMSSSNALLAKDMTAIDQLELAKKINTLWADQNTSLTVYYKKEELPEIRDWLKNNLRDNVKGISFLLHTDHGFAQAPYEEIDENTYKKLTKNLNLNVLYNKIDSSTVIQGIECDSEVCPIR